MQKGLDNDEFEVYYQPIIKVENEEVIGAEALIRWIHPRYGFIPPDVFIGLMEKTGFIVKLGQFVLEEVLKQQKRWELFKFKQIHVSINVSMIEIATGDFVEHVEQELIHHQVNPELIKFEITEGTAMISEIQTEKYFYKLKKLGVGISLDDFGTGYTSFTYLKKFPADILKIDKSLVDHILLNTEDQRIVKAMIELGHNLGMKIVVEGIETKKMVALLASYECDYMQGYYFAKPLPVFEFQKLLR
jgi:polar amino acid transport system substrate-binding protein